MAITRITKGVIKPNENYDTHNIVSTGIITSVGADINGDLDVDGHTNLDNVSISGVTTFAGSVNNLVLSGVVTTTGLDVNGNADISGNLSVGGVLTYEDVTSIDSVGIITARNDIHVGAGVSAVGVGTFGSLDIGGDIDVDGHTNLDNISIAGVSTFASKVSVGGSITATAIIQAAGGDNKGIKLGNSLHLADAVNTQITQQNNSSIYLNADNIELRNRAAGSYRQYIRCGSWASGAVGLFHDDGSNANERLRTTSSGINVTGNVVSDGLVVDGNTDLNGDIDVDGHTNLDNLSIAGVTTTTDNIIINADNKILKIGASQDLHLFHQGGTSIIKDINDNPINIQSDGEIKLAKDGNAETYARFIPDGAVELYHDNTKTFATNSTGASIYQRLVLEGTGPSILFSDTNNSPNYTITADGGALRIADSSVGNRLIFNANGSHSITGFWSVSGSVYGQYGLSTNGHIDINDDGDKLRIGASQDLELYHNGSNSFIVNKTGYLQINATETEVGIYVNPNAAVRLAYNGDMKFETTASGARVFNGASGGGILEVYSGDAGSAAGPELKLIRNSASPADADYIGQIKFVGESDTSVERNYAKITGKILDASNGTEDGIIEFAHIKGGSQVITGRWRSDSLQLLNDTNLSVAGDTTLTGDLDVDGHTNLDNVNIAGVTTFASAINGSGQFVWDAADADVIIRDSTDSPQNFIYRDHSASKLYLGTTSNVVELRSNLLTNADSTYDIGTNSVRWRNAYVDTYYGDGSNLTGISVGVPGISTTGTSIFNNVTVSGISTINSLIVENYDGSGNSGIMTVPWKLGQSYSGGGAGGGTSNQVWGQFAGQNLSLSAAVQNVIIGREAAKGLDRGDSNVFIGSQAGPYDSGNNYENCDNNTVVSGHSMYFAGGNAKGNSVFGYHASYDLRGAQFNTTVGYAAAKNVMNGGECVVIGHSAAEGSSAYHPNSLVAIGASAAKNITSAQNVIVIGNNANPSSNTPSNEITLGDSDINHFRVPGIGVSFSAGGGVVTGIMTASSFKLLDGSAVGGVESDAQGNTVAGSGAGDSFTGTDAENNTLFGKDAGTAITSADSTTAVGKDAGKSITTGSYNHLFGIGAGDAITTGTNNTIMGHYAGSSFQTASENTIIGGNAGGGSSLGSNNVIVGKSCNQNNEGSNNVFIGQGAIAYRGGTASNNVIIGQAAADLLTNGNHNAGVGQNVFDDISTGSDNSALGSNAGDTLTTGSNNLFLGHDAFPSSATVSNEVTIGDTNITKFRIPGINVTLKDNGGTPTQGHVLTVDGNGEAGFAAVSSDLVNDTSPQLGADLDCNQKGILLQARNSGNQGAIKWGDNGEMWMFHAGSDNTNRIYSSGKEWAIWSGSSNDHACFKVTASNTDPAVELYYNNTRRLRTYSGGVKISTNSSHGRLVFEDTDGNFCWQLSGFDAAAYGTGGGGVFQDATGATVLDMRGSGTNIHSHNNIKLSAGGTADNLKLYFGAGDDLQIYHDGSHSYLDNTGGVLHLRSIDDIKLQTNTSELAIKCDANGAVELYYNNSKKAETVSGGFTVTGDLTATGFVDSSSDIKLKTNIKTIDNALDKVLQLRGAEYDRIDRDNQHEIGVIAQEVEKIIPEVVHGDETKTVSYGNLVGLLIEAVKDLKKEIDELKSS